MYGCIYLIICIKQFLFRNTQAQIFVFNIIVCLFVYLFLYLCINPIKLKLLLHCCNDNYVYSRSQWNSIDMSQAAVENHDFKQWTKSRKLHRGCLFCHRCFGSSRQSFTAVVMKLHRLLVCLITQSQLCCISGHAFGPHLGKSW